MISPIEKLSNGEITHPIIIVRIATCKALERIWIVGFGMSTSIDFVIVDP